MEMNINEFLTDDLVEISDSAKELIIQRCRQISGLTRDGDVYVLLYSSGAAMLSDSGELLKSIGEHLVVGIYDKHKVPEGRSYKLGEFRICYVMNKNPNETPAKVSVFADDGELGIEFAK